MLRFWTQIAGQTGILKSFPSSCRTTKSSRSLPARILSLVSLAPSSKLHSKDMTDVFDQQKRSAVMAAIRSTGNLSTELRLVSLLRRERIAGWRRHQYLAGRPDFVFTHQRVAIFVDGCFWHGCDCRSIPVTRRNFWRNKIQQNRKRDKLVSRQLRAKKWTVLRFWEHELVFERHVIGRIRRALAKMERTNAETRRK
jgi:DNA mismatch endonuclease (patch repair protein)